LDKKKALENTINFFKNPDSFNKPVTDPTHNNPSDAHTTAANWRDEANLKNNPGYIEAIGDPNIVKGKIITILGVGKKHSGNWYITKVEHLIGDGKSYMMRIDIVRQGSNIKVNNSYAGTDQTNKVLNKQIGPDVTKQKTKQPQITKNPR